MISVSRWLPCASGILAALAFTAATAAPAAAGNAGLQVSTSTGLWATVPLGTDAVSSTALLTGQRVWGFSIQPGASVTNPTITVNSGFAPSSLGPFSAGSQQPGAPLAALPYVVTQPSLSPGEQSMCCAGLVSSATLVQATGFDSSRTVNPVTIPVGGATQTTTVALTDPQPNALIKITITSVVPGATLASATGPANANQGEGLKVEPSATGAGFVLGQALPGKQYDFTVTLNTPNPLAQPFDYKPMVQILSFGPPVPPVAFSQGSAVSVDEPTLDGSTPGAGTVTYSVDQFQSWEVDQSDTFVALKYEGSPPPPPSPRVQAEHTIGLIDSWSLDPGVANSLTSKLDAFVAALARGSREAACNELDAFVQEATAQAGQHLTAAQSDELRDRASGISAAAGCR